MASSPCPSCPFPSHAVLAWLIPSVPCRAVAGHAEALPCFPGSPVQGHSCLQPQSSTKGVVSLWNSCLASVWRRGCWEGKLPGRAATQVGLLPVLKPRDSLAIRMSSRGVGKTVPNSPCLRTACHPWLHDWCCALEFASGFAVSPSSMGFLFIEIQDQRKALSGGLTWYRKDSLLFSLADAPMVCIASPWSLWHPLSLCTRIRRSRATSTAGRTHYSLPTACQEHNAWTSPLAPQSPPSFKPRPSLALISAIGS